MNNNIIINNKNNIIIFCVITSSRGYDNDSVSYKKKYANS